MSIVIIFDPIEIVKYALQFGLLYISEIESALRELFLVHIAVSSINSFNNFGSALRVQMSEEMREIEVLKSWMRFVCPLRIGAKKSVRQER